MSKEKKQYKMYSIKMDSETSDALEAYCQKTGMTKTAVIEKGVMLYINSCDSIQEKLRKFSEYEAAFQELLKKAGETKESD